MLPDSAKSPEETAALDLSAREEVEAYLDNLVQGLLITPLPIMHSAADRSPPFSFSLLQNRDCLREVVFSGRNPFLVQAPLEDTMNGVIDLVFRHAGKYYIADWKTNWLPNYGRPELAEEMESQDYYLQAALYADAVSKWLKLSRLPADSFGGVLYIFVRAFTTDPYYEGIIDEALQDAARASGDTPGVLFIDTTELASLAARYQIGECT